MISFENVFFLIVILDNPTIMNLHESLPNYMTFYGYHYEKPIDGFEFDNEKQRVPSHRVLEP